MVRPNLFPRTCPTMAKPPCRCRAAKPRAVGLRVRLLPWQITSQVQNLGPRICLLFQARRKSPS